MSARLAGLRRSLDLFPSPVADRPGLLLRDPFGYTSKVLIIPPPLVPMLRFFDGEHSEADLAAALFQATDDPAATGFARQLASMLGNNGFLEDEELERRRKASHSAFAAASRRLPAHAGQAYPEDPREIEAMLDPILPRAVSPGPASADVFAIAAPHVSFEGGARCYADAYAALPDAAAAHTFVVLGTSHYGLPERFGLTRKPYETPLGTSRSEPEIVERLVRQAGDAVVVEDYCHAVEHSIEFQVLLLQRRFGPAVRVVPILCGPFAQATSGRGRPEDDPGVARFLGALRDLDARERGRLTWVLGVDLAHVGRRYGDDVGARAGEGPLEAVRRRDGERLSLLLTGDRERFWDAVRMGGDDLRWCGASPLYSFLYAAAPVRGALLRYEQWNIDPASVVSFAALAFNRRGGHAAAEGDS